MAEITSDLREQYGSTCALIPADVLTRIDEDEVLDRLDEAHALYRKAEQAPADISGGYRDRARAVCQAEPRDVTEQQAQQWLAKADAAASAAHRGTCLDEAQAIRARQPQAPRRTRTGPAAEERRRRQAEARLRSDITKAAAAKQAELAAQVVEDRAFLAKCDQTRGVTKAQLKAMVRIAVAESLAQRA